MALPPRTAAATRRGDFLPPMAQALRWKRTGSGTPRAQLSDPTLHHTGAGGEGADVASRSFNPCALGRAMHSIPFPYRLIVNRAAVSNGMDNDDATFPIQFANDAIVAHAIAPQAESIVPQNFPEVARIGRGRNPSIHVIKNFRGHRAVEFLQVPQRSRAIFNGPAQVLFALDRW